MIAIAKIIINGITIQFEEMFPQDTPINQIEGFMINLMKNYIRDFMGNELNGKGRKVKCRLIIKENGMGKIDKILDKLEKLTFKAEVYNKDFDGENIENLICLGDVKEVIEECMNDEWISVEERLPKEREEFIKVIDPISLDVIEIDRYTASDEVEVTVCDQEKEEYFIKTDFTVNGEWHDSFYSDGIYKVVAWKPLPDPYLPEPLETRKELERRENERD